MPIALLIALQLAPISSSTLEDVQYGEVYFEDSSALQLPDFSLGLGYAKDLNSTFLDLHSVAGNAQFRVWKYISTGILGVWSSKSLTQAGKQLQGLKETADLEFDTVVPQWGVFSLTNVQLLVGKWNILNLFPLQVDLVLGAGAGLLQRKKRLADEGKIAASYVWSVEQRIRILENISFYVAFFSHRDTVFIHPGFMASVEF